MDFTQPWDYGDVIFVVEEKKIYANKTVLGMSSDVFKAMFTSDFREKKMTEIPLPDKKFDGFLQLMQIVHPQVNKCVDENNVADLLPLAHEYQMHHVVENCEKYLQTEPSVDNLILAEEYDAHDAYESCLEYLKDTPLRALKYEDGFTNLNADILKEVLWEKIVNLNIEVSMLASWEIPQVDCPDCMCNRGEGWNCSTCKKYSCTNGKTHCPGTKRDCLECYSYMFDKVCEAVKKC